MGLGWGALRQHMKEDKYYLRLGAVITANGSITPD